MVSTHLRTVLYAGAMIWDDDGHARSRTEMKNAILAIVHADMVRREELSALQDALGPASVKMWEAVTATDGGGEDSAHDEAAEDRSTRS
jgi:hypothetical protein